MIPCNRGLLVVWLGLLVACPARAAEDKVEKMSADQTQQNYTRKSFTYMGIRPLRGVNVPPDGLAVIEARVRKAVQLKRFDYNAVDSHEFGTFKAFAEALRDYVQKCAVDRAAAEAEYETRFKSARVYAKDVDRIMNSVYMYGIEVKAYRVEAFACWMEKVRKKVVGLDGKEKTVEMLEERCRPGAPSRPEERAEMRATVGVAVPILKANLTTPSAPPTTAVLTLRGQSEDTQVYESPPPPPQREKLPTGADEQQRRWADERYRQAQQAYQAALAEYQRTLPERQHRAGLEAVASAVNSLAPGMTKSLKSHPDFMLKTPVTAALSDGVEFMLGQAEGLELDDTYDVAEFDAAGQQSGLGYVKVRQIGDATGSGEGTPSYAEKVKEKRKFVGGEQLFEHPMIGGGVGVFGSVEIAFLDFFDRDKLLVMGGGGFYADGDVSGWFGHPELYAGFELDYHFVGDDGSGDNQWHLLHTMFGFKKKWYANSLVFDLGLRVGLSEMLNAGSGTGTYFIGAGGDLMLGFEYYIIPEFSLFLKVNGRFFGWVASDVSLDGMNHEMAAACQAGLIFSY